MITKFFSNYDTSEGLLKRFLANYPIWDNQLNFTIAEDYDYAVVFNNTSEFIRPDAKIITVIQEPSWSKAHENSRFLTQSNYLIVHDQALFEKAYGKLGGEVIESPSYMFYNDRVDKSFFHYAASTKKVKKLSMIVSYLNKPTGIYQKRFALLNKILDKRFKGFIDYKFTGLLLYTYSIAIENSEEKNYITGKFVDCILCNTIPIYHGAPNIGEVYDNRYFKQIDLDSPRIIQDIKEIISQIPIYTSTNKSVYFESFNLYEKLKDIVFSN